MYLGRIVEAGAVGAIFRHAAAPLHTGAAAGDAEHGPGPPHRSLAAQRRPAKPDQPAFRLPLPTRCAFAEEVCAERHRRSAPADSADDAHQRRLPHAGSRLRPQPRARWRWIRSRHALNATPGKRQPGRSFGRRSGGRFQQRDRTIHAVNGVSFRLARWRSAWHPRRVRVGQKRHIARADAAPAA